MGSEPKRSRPPERDPITDLLQAHGEGDARAMANLAPLVYEELRRIARNQLRRERDGHTLQTTGLVHEAFAKFVGLERIRLTDRSHFFALSARLMRQVLTDYAKRRQAGKRQAVPGVFESAAETADTDAEDILDLDRALAKLAHISDRQVRIIECRFFAGLTVEETAEALDISKATVKRDWQLARAWLNRELA